MNPLLSIIAVTFLISCGNPFGPDTEVGDSFGGDAGPSRVSIETAAGGAGTEVTNLSVTDGTPTTLYAVSRTSAGSFVEDITVSWSIANALGTLSSSNGTSTVFTPNAGAGGETVTATHSSLTSDTASLAVSYTVTDIAGLQLWLKADGSVTYDGTNEVSDWIDHSGNSNDFSQTTPTLRPLFVTSGIGGLPSIRFDATDDLMTGPAVISGTSARTIIFAINEITTFGTYDAPMDLASSVSGTGTNYGITNEIGVRVSGNRIFGTGLTTGVDTVVTIVNANADNVSNTLAFINNTELTQTSSAGAALNTNSDGMRLGQAAFGSSQCNCDIAEVIIYNQDISAGDRTNVQQYLYNKYSITP